MIILLGWHRPHTQKLCQVRSCLQTSVVLRWGAKARAKGCYLFSWCQVSQGAEIGCVCYHHGLWQEACMCILGHFRLGAIESCT